MTEGSDRARAAWYPAVLAALRQAATGTQLQVKAQGDLYGASVIGPLVEAYVIPAPHGGIQVDLWRHDGDDPYRTVVGQDLADAVRLAVTEAASAGEPRWQLPPPQASQPTSDTDCATQREGS